MHLFRHISVLGCALLVASAGCRQKSSSSADHSAQSDPGVVIQWPENVQCEDPTVVKFVRDALSCCASGDYDAYRLLWRWDHRPTSRKHFERQVQAIHRVEVKLLKQVVFLLPDERLDDDPRYVLQAHIKIRDEFRGRGGKLEDRDLVLLIVRDGDQWRFVPAIDEVKAELLGTDDGVRLAPLPGAPTSE